MRTFAKVLIVLVAVTLTGCGVIVAQAPVVPPAGLLFTSTAAPLDTDVENTDLGSKQGSASCYSVLLLVAFGDASTDAAARNGGIKVIKHADYSSLNVLGLFTSYKTIVYGE